MTIAAHGGCRMKSRVRHLQSKAMQGTARHGTPGKPKLCRLSQASSRPSRPGQAKPRQVMARVCAENWRLVSGQPHPTEQTWRVFAPKSGGWWVVSLDTSSKTAAAFRHKMLPCFVLRPPRGSVRHTLVCSVGVWLSLKQAASSRRKKGAM